MDYWLQFVENIKSLFLSSPGNWVLLIVLILPTYIVIRRITNSWKLGFLIAAIFLVSILQPFKLSPEALFSFAAFLIVGIGIRWQKEAFDWRNRPYIQLLEQNINVHLTHQLRMNNNKPEPELELRMGFINHGPLPASLTEIKVKANRSLDNLRENDGVWLGPYEVDRAKQWRNLDIFPFIDDDRSIRYLSRRVYLSIEDYKKLFAKELDSQEILRGSNDVNAGLKASPFLSGLSRDIFPYFYILIELKYFTFGEQNSKKQPYFYWAIFSHANNKYSFVESGT